jgi:hypothetical protein
MLDRGEVPKVSPAYLCLDEGVKAVSLDEGSVTVRREAEPIRDPEPSSV